MTYSFLICVVSSFPIKGVKERWGVGPDCPSIESAVKHGEYYSGVQDSVFIIEGGQAQKIYNLQGDPCSDEDLEHATYADAEKIRSL